MDCFFVIRILVVAILVNGSFIKSLAQTSVSTNPSQGDAVLTKLVQPFYPPLARQARITGDVELTLEVSKDGNVQSAVVVNGHPLLKQAALDSAQQSQFECRKCGEAATVRLVYTFQLAGSESCCMGTERSGKDDKPDQILPRVIQSENHVTVVDRPACCCDPAVQITRVRAAKCLYLWRCGVVSRVVGN